MSRCLIVGCPNKARKRSPICKNCASTSGRWLKRGPDAILSRQETLEYWQNRMQYLGHTHKEYRNVAKQIERRRSVKASLDADARRAQARE